MFNSGRSKTKDDSTVKEINKLVAQLPSVHTNWGKLGQNKNREICGKVEKILSEILYDWFKYLQSDEIKSVIDKIEPYMDKLKKTHNTPSVQGKYAWFLEKKMDFSDKEEEVKEIYQKILAIYQCIFKKKPEVAHWTTRVNYINFLSRKSEGCIPIGEEFLEKAKTMAIKPNKSELSRIYTILAIEYEKEGQYEKMFEYAKIAKNFDPKYAPVYSILGKYYQTKGEVIKSKYYYDKGIEYYELARHENEARFNKNHPFPTSNQKIFVVRPQQPSINSTAILHKRMPKGIETKNKLNPKLENASKEEINSGKLNPGEMKFVPVNTGLLSNTGLSKSNARLFFPPSPSRHLTTSSARVNQKPSEFVPATQYQLKK